MKTHEKIAVIGYHHILPNEINNDDAFWDLMYQRKCSYNDPSSRYGKGLYRDSKEGVTNKMISKYENIILNKKELLFDNSFFNISENEIKTMDPQHRMMLRCCWHSAEKAGIDITKLRNKKVGVFIGTQDAQVSKWDRTIANKYQISSIASNMIANRVSYAMNLMGPSASYFTACSSSITALDACMNAITMGECDSAFFGGVSFNAGYETSLAFSKLGIISPDGKCRSFDTNANGYCRSEGCIGFLLKRLDLAEQNGDNIYCVLSGTNLNCAGSMRHDNLATLNPHRGIFVPTIHGQMDVMAGAIARSQSSLEEIDYFEAHGTGTVVGDFIEGTAIDTLFKKRKNKTMVRVSSIKSNMGHMEGTSFALALLKVVMMMEKRTFIPISENFQTLNPKLRLKKTRIITEPEDFPDKLVKIGINSFGFGGANGCCIVEEYADTDVDQDQKKQPDHNLDQQPNKYIIPISGKDIGGVEKYSTELVNYCEQHNVSLHDIAANLSLRRTQYKDRTFIIANSMDDFITKAKNGEFVYQNSILKPDQKLVMVFSGQGTQYCKCAESLYYDNQKFRQMVDFIDNFWFEKTSISLKDIAFGDDQELLNKPVNTQPIIFMIQAGLLECYKEWDIKPDAVIGHSFGELTAAYACGMVDLNDILNLLLLRAKTQDNLSGKGKMIVINLSEDEFNDYMENKNHVVELPQQSYNISMAPMYVARLDKEASNITLDQYDVACKNTNNSIVVSGSVESIANIKRIMDQENIFNKTIEGNSPFHSRFLDEYKKDFIKKTKKLKITYNKSTIPMISSIDGKVKDMLDDKYWWKNMRKCVDFESAIEKINDTFKNTIMMELSPSPTLKYHVEKTNTFIGSLNKNIQDSEALLTSIGKLWCNNIKVNFASMYSEYNILTKTLPLYPMNLKRIIDSTIDYNYINSKNGYEHGPMIGQAITQGVFKNYIGGSTMAWLLGHRVNGKALMPAAGYIEMVVESMGQFPFNINSVYFMEQLEISKKKIDKIFINKDKRDLDDNVYDIEINTVDYIVKKNNHCKAMVTLAKTIEPEQTISYTRPERFSQNLMNHNSIYEIWEITFDSYFDYQDAFQVIKEAYRDPDTNELWLQLEMDLELFETCQDNGYLIHPCLLDGALQSSIFLLFQDIDCYGFPTHMKNAVFYQKMNSNKIITIAKPSNNYKSKYGCKYIETGHKSLGSLKLYNQDGSIVANISELYASIVRKTFENEPIYKILMQPKIFTPIVCHDVKSLQDFIKIQTNRNDYQHRILEIVDRESKLLDLNLKNTEYCYGSTDSEYVGELYDQMGHLSKKLRFQHFDKEKDNLRENSFDIIIVKAKVCMEFVNKLLIDGGILCIDNIDIDSDSWSQNFKKANLCSSIDSSDFRDFEENPKVDESDDQREVARHLPTQIYVKDKYSINNQVSIVKKKALIMGKRNELFDELHEKLIESYDPIVFDINNSESEEFLDDSIDTIFYYAGKVSQFALDEFEELIKLGNYLIKNCRTPKTMWFFSQQSVGDDTESIDTGALYGMIRSLNIETDPILRTFTIDIKDNGDVSTTINVMHRNMREIHYNIRNGIPHVPRIFNIDNVVTKESDYMLSIENPGLSGLKLVNNVIKKLGPNDVMIKIKSSALNFRDIMVMLDRLPPLSYERSSLGHTLGMEASGIVVGIGTDVTRLNVGDDVVVLKGGCLASVITADQNTVFKKPSYLNYSEASSIVSVYVTAYYAMVWLARLKANDSILIHSAMGGVGMAAIVIAKSLGLTIYATAGTEEKRQKLLSMGVSHVFDSHSYDWCQELSLVAPQGVTAVLNSLAGKHIRLGLQALSHGGWFLEIGKMDIYSDSKMGMQIFRKNIGYRAIDVDRLMQDDPELGKDLIERVMENFNQKIYTPIPYTEYSFSDYKSAFNSMMKGKHQGKQVLVHDKPIELKDNDKYLSGTWLVTGGFGGMGQKVVSYLAHMGVDTIVLMDRSPEKGRTIELDIGTIAIEKGDVSVYSDVERIVKKYSKQLKGIVHLSGVLNDMSIAKQNRKSYLKTLKPKAIGAWNLHKSSIDEGCNLEKFIVFSSISALFGNNGQSNYSASNAYLDSLMSYRNKHGMPSMTYNMGGVSNTGMALENLDFLKIMRHIGLTALSGNEAIRILDVGMRQSLKQTIGFRIKGFKLKSSTFEFSTFGSLIENDVVMGSCKIFTPNNVRLILREKMKSLIGSEDIKDNVIFTDFGVDSITAIELSKFIQDKFDFTMNLNMFMENTINSLSVLISNKSLES